MARKIGTRRNRRYGKHGGFMGLGEGSKRSWGQYFGFTPETPTTAQYLGLAKPPNASIPEALGAAKPQTLASDVGLTGGEKRVHYFGGQIRKHFSSRAGKKMRKSRGTRKSKKTRKHRK
jgi:hypothetical protein